MSNRSFVPKNINAMRIAKDVHTSIFENIAIMPENFEMYPFLPADYNSLCTGCTEPDATNFNPLAEVNDSTCL
jgi:hypothetical protein